MKALLKVLLVAVCVDTVVSDLKKSKTTEHPKRLKGMEGTREKKTGELLSRIEKDFESVPNLWRNLSKCEGTLQKGVSLSQEQKDFLENVLYKKISKKTLRVEKSIEGVNSKSGIADALFQGDMLLSKDQKKDVMRDSTRRNKRQAPNDKSYPGKRWPYVVSYTLDGTLDDDTKEAFKNATYLWMNDTCIDFMEDTSEEAEDIILVYKHDGCWAEVGRHGGWQLISLGEGCNTVGIAAHEIGHALGFIHTHSRHDRDQFITVVGENASCSWLRQFEAETPDNNNNYNLTYDYGSIMHYGASPSFGNDSGKLTMLPKDIMYTETLGSHIISFYDLLMMNTYYNCTDKCKDRDTDECSNGGFHHPRNCSTCLCPSGYGGQFCNERPPGCGAILNATQNWTMLENPLNRTEAGKDGFMRCNYWIKAPDNKTIEVKVVEVPHTYYHQGCTNAGVEIKTHSDQRRTGYRFCSPSAANITLQSNSSMVPVITYMNELFFEKENQQLSAEYYDVEESSGEGEDSSGEESEDNNDEDGNDSEHYEESEENGDINEEDHTGVKLEYRYV